MRASRGVLVVFCESVERGYAAGTTVAESVLRTIAGWVADGGGGAMGCRARHAGILHGIGGHRHIARIEHAGPPHREARAGIA